VFGHGRYALASMPCVAKGLHAVRFMVIAPRAGSVLSLGEDKREVLSSARRMLQTVRASTAANEEQWAQTSLWPSRSRRLSSRNRPQRSGVNKGCSA